MNRILSFLMLVKYKRPSGGEQPLCLAVKLEGEGCSLFRSLCLCLKVDIASVFAPFHVTEQLILLEVSPFLPILFYIRKWEIVMNAWRVNGVFIFSMN